MHVDVISDPRPVSLVICTYRRARSVMRLLSELRRQTEPAREVIVVDGSPGDETEVALAGETSTGSSVRYCHVPPEHRGLTRQRNFGIARATGELIGFLDDDTVPEPTYLQRIRECFARHPDAAGVGGYITGVPWTRVAGEREPLGLYRHDGWVRREDYRWRLRRLLGLASSLPPGWMPPFGHGRSVGFLPPDGRDHRVEFFMGGVSTWRRAVLERYRFSEQFAGYGLYEDLEFCLRVSRDHPLYVCTGAMVAHEHDPGARPHAYRYGAMVVRHGWHVWRKRWPDPALADRLRWWSITVLLAMCRLADTVRGPGAADALAEAAGRCRGMLAVFGGRHHSMS